jgi:hypothetical protein
MAASNSSGGKPEPSNRSVRRNGRHCIRTAAWRETATLAKERTDESPITLDRDDEKLG